MKRFISIFVMALLAGYVPVHPASTTTNVPPTATAIAIEKTTAPDVTTENTIIPEATVTIAPQATTATVLSETGLGWLAFLEHGRITVLRLTEEDGSLLQILKAYPLWKGILAE